MSLTALGFLAVYFTALVLALVWQPAAGLVAYFWTFYNYPAAAGWWGQDLPNFRWSLIAAIVTLVGLIVQVQREAAERRLERERDAAIRPNAPRRAPWYGSFGLKVIAVFAVWMWVQTGWAANTDYNIEGAILFTKYVVLFGVIYGLLKQERGLELFAFAFVLGSTYWSWVGWRTPMTGRWEALLGPGIDDSNVLGVHLVTAMAFAGFLFLSTGGIKRWIAFATLPFLLNGVILTASRSAVVGLVGAGAAALMFAPKGRRAVVVVCGALGVVLLLMLAKSDLFWARTATITETHEGEMESSAASRIPIAAANLRMFEDHPFGLGHRGNEFVSAKYMADQLLTTGNVRSAHNTEMAILADHGIPGIVLFALLVGWAAARLFALRRLDKRRLPIQLGAYRAAIGAGLAAHLVAGQFVNLLSAEAVIWLLAMLAALDARAAIWGAEQTREPEPARTLGSARPGGSGRLVLGRQPC